MNASAINAQQLQKMKTQPGFVAALDQEVEERVKAAQGQLPALEDAREIAGDQAPLDIGERLWVGLALAAEKPHRGTPAILRGPI